MKGSGNGADSLISEFIVNRAAVFCGFPVPNAHLLQIEDGFPWTFGTDEFDDIVQRSYGMNLAIEFIPDTRLPDLAKPHCLPSPFLEAMLAIDIFFRNLDRTAASGNVLIDKTAKIWLIDHGSCRFLSQNIIAEDGFLPENHLLKQIEAEFEIGRAIDPLIHLDYDSLILKELPPEWLKETNMSRQQISAALESRKVRLNMG